MEPMAKRPPVVETEMGPLPDVTELFDLGDACPELCGECHQCDPWGAFTPRNALLMYLCAELVACELSSRLERGQLDELRRELPPVCGQVDEIWLERWVQCHTDICERIEAGEIPWPRCTGEEMALHSVLANMCAARDGDAFGCHSGGVFATLPRHEDDHAHERLRDQLLEDDHVLALFDERFGGCEPDVAAFEELGMVNMLPEQWFLPFHA